MTTVANLGEATPLRGKPVPSVPERIGPAILLRASLPSTYQKPPKMKSDKNILRRHFLGNYRQYHT